ncbi:sulfur carrier protein ThiS [Clostridium sp. LBM24168]
MIVNGEKMELQAGITILDLLKTLNIDSNNVAVEVDMEIADRGQFGNIKLDSNSKVEIIRFVGGG